MWANSGTYTPGSKVAGHFVDGACGDFPARCRSCAFGLFLLLVFSLCGLDVSPARAQSGGPPAVVFQTPSPGAVGQAVTSRVAATFSEAIQPSSVTFKLVDSSNNAVPATVSYDPSSYSVTLTPNAYLSTAQTYTATLSGATDLSGNVMIGSVIWSFSTGSMTVGAPTVDANGVKSYVVTSTFQGPQSMTVRVLEPTSPAPGRPHRLLYVMPVEIGVTSLTSTYSDGLEELRLAGVPNQYNMTLVAPSFNYMPWYGDNVTNSQYLMESFVINDLMPFGDTFAKGTEIMPRLAIGFSKSGNGVLFLILRHPNVFSGVAAWDSPAQLNNLNTFAPDLQTNFGTQANFNLLPYSFSGCV